MRICIAPDSFKESLSAVEAAESIARGVRNVSADFEIVSVPMADGGEGTVSTLVHATGGRTVSVRVTGPLGEPVDAEFGLLGDGTTAVIEMAAASGLALVRPDRRNPMIATTCGTGELVKAALDHGARKIIIGIGGSATVDGGAGMAQALGVRFLDQSGRDIPRGGGGLASLHSIDLTGLDARIRQTEILVACDVDNPLTGQRGAAPVYGPQKGATPEMVQQLSENLGRLAAVIRRDAGVDVEHLPGAGAAGGLGAGLVVFLNARLRPGIEIVMEAARLDERMAGCDLVFTGEGRLDQQTLHGKVPLGVARLASEYGIPVIALAGCVGRDRTGLNAAGIGAFFSIMDCPMSLDDAFSRAAELLAATAEQAVRAFLLGRGCTPSSEGEHKVRPTAGRRIVLASNSPERRKLLAGMGLAFDVIPADIDETMPAGVPPRDAAVMLAGAKAEAVAKIVRARGIRGIVIGADTIVVAAAPDGTDEVIGKPDDDAHAVAILRRLSGSRHSVVTGLCVLDSATGRRLSAWDETRITMAAMTDEQIRDYVATGEPRGKSGAYSFREQGDPYVKEFTGSFSNVLGLPVELLREFLEQMMNDE